MRKKKLLKESTVRQFMKLANLKPLASSFITETYGDEQQNGLYEQEDDELEGEDEMLPPEAGMEDEMNMMAGEDELLPGEEEGGALEGVSEEAVEELISVVADALASATGVEIDVMGGEEGLDMSPEAEAAEAGMDFAPATGEEGEEEELAEINMIDEDAVMKETYRRVAKRLSGMNKQHKLVESVTNRIMEKLAKAK